MIRKLAVVLFIVVVTVLSWLFWPREISPPPTLTDCGLRLQDTGQCIRFEVVDTAEARTKGLSGRESLAADQGMLFQYDTQQAVCIWMKDMHFSIDIVWIDAGGWVSKIEEHVSPDSYPQTFCSDTTFMVLELPAGTVDKTNITLERSFRR